MTFTQDRHYAYTSTAARLSFFTSSRDYYSVLAEVLPKAQKRILIVGWSFDDRIRLVRDRDTGPSGPELGDLLLSIAKEKPSIRVDLCIWKPPSLFAADQHITHKFRKEVHEAPNMDLHQLPAESAFASRHEKFVILDDVLAFIGGIDLTRERWDSPEHPAKSPARVNPEGEAYGPYHDTHAVMSGPAVRELLSLAEEEFSLDLSPDTEPPSLWPEGIPVDAENARIMISLTRSSPDADVPDLRQIRKVYRDMLSEAREFIFIENQYFSSDEITDLLVRRLREKEGPELIILMSRELPDMLGRMTMGVNASMHIAKLRENDHHGRLGFFNPVSPDDPATPVKVHSKLMITDSRFLTLGSGNINQRSFSFDNEVNILMDAQETDDPGCVAKLEDRILAQHCGVSPEEWREQVRRNGGSRLSAFRERSSSWEGLQEPGELLPPGSVPQELLDYFDMEGAPRPEEALHTMTKDEPRGIIARTRKIWGLMLLTAVVLGAVFFLSRTDVDIHELLGAVRELNETRPGLAALLTIVSFWLSMLVFVSITVPIVSFAALHGPWFGILYSTLGVFSGAAIFYALGLVLHTNPWFDRFRAVRHVKKQFEKIRPYGLWAVAISRMVPSGPFLVVNLVTGMLGFRPSQFLLGSLIGLMPGIIAFTVFGETIRKVFTDPGWMNILMFVLLLAAYFAIMTGIVSLVRKISGIKT
ncbi:VTT domain-containing protein [Marispirochaeta aestuarii]|uniref:VTT domain-containing protein n=1 Tax=Marispirochaeta aestuarii TaxID=1963862 RepID=UPI0029C9A739|nr:VTT domain-containing protein [Marispirochaeta aestuarii]